MHNVVVWVKSNSAERDLNRFLNARSRCGQRLLPVLEARFHWYSMLVLVGHLGGQAKGPSPVRLYGLSCVFSGIVVVSDQMLFSVGDVGGVW
jgi:hypothetical protein